jgi:hypothetical protein
VQRGAPVDEVIVTRNTVDTTDPTACAPYVHSVLTLVLKSSDGSLDEELPVDTRVFSAERVQIRGMLAVSTLKGTLSVAEGVRLDVTVDFEETAYRGYLVASRADEIGGVVSSLATWTE